MPHDILNEISRKALVLKEKNNNKQWCCRCKKYHELSLFDVDTRRSTGRSAQCRECKRKRKIKYDSQKIKGGSPIQNTVFNIRAEQFLPRLNDNFIDLTITSPPYDNMRDYDNIVNIDLISKELLRATKQGGIVVWVVADATINGSETGTSFRHALKFLEAGWNLFDTMIYAKPPRGAVGNNKTYWQSFEYMFVFSKGIPKTINLIRDRRNLESRDGDNGTKRLRNGTILKVKRKGYGEFGRRTNIWEYGIGFGQSATDKIAFQHPAIFPELLAKDHILSWSNPGELVCDIFMGSGTVAKMARLCNRNYTGSEINPAYIKIINQRLKS